MRAIRILMTVLNGLLSVSSSGWAQDPLAAQAVSTMRKAAEFYREQVATHGGYVYHYSPDLQVRWGEGLATSDQIWVQPPGTPTVGMAYLDAYVATGDPFYLEAAKAAAQAVAYGQLKSGGWQNCVDFNPRGKRLHLYRNGKGSGKNASSFDDGQTQSALLLMIKTDAALKFADPVIHESALVGLRAVLAAQYPNGGFPQVFTGPVPSQPVVKANYPEYDWRTQGRVKNYWDMYTLNDNSAGYLAQLLIEAHKVYQDEQALAALHLLGDFLLLSQMPQPQPGWAQQYNYNMQPIGARKFEPPGVSGDETQEVLETLLAIVEYTRDPKYLQPIPAAIAWLKKSELADGRMARYYELKTNRPLYMQREGENYSLTYSDANLPSHYGWKTDSRIEWIESEVKRVKNGKALPEISEKELVTKVREIIESLDQQGRWLTVATGERLVGQPEIRAGEAYLSSAIFSQNLSTLSNYLRRKK